MTDQELQELVERILATFTPARTTNPRDAVRYQRGG